MSSIPTRQIEMTPPPERFARGWHCVGLSKTFKDEPIGIEAFGIRIVDLSEYFWRTHCAASGLPAYGWRSFYGKNRW